MASLSVRSPTRAFGYGTASLLVMRSYSHTGTTRARRFARSAVPPRLPARHVKTSDARATHLRLCGPHPTGSTEATSARSSGWLPGDCRIVADHTEFYSAFRDIVRWPGKAAKRRIAA